MLNTRMASAYRLHQPDIRVRKAFLHDALAHHPCGSENENVHTILGANIADPPMIFAYSSEREEMRGLNFGFRGSHPLVALCLLSFRVDSGGMARRSC